MSLRDRWAIWCERRDLAVDVDVIGALAGREWHYGLDLMRATGYRGGRFHPSIDRLEDAGIVEAKWIEGAYPRRRLYRLIGEADTGEGT